MKKLLVLLSFISLSFCGFLFAGCDPYSNMKINLSDTTVVLSRSTDLDADVKTISATVKGAKGDISDEVVFISSKPEVVEVVKTTYADGTTKAELKAMGAGDAVVYAIAEGNVKKSITVKVEQNALGVGFTSNLSPVITRGEDFRFIDSYVSFYPANTSDKTYDLKLLSQDGETVVYDMASSNYIPASVTESLTESLYKLKLTKIVGENTFTDVVSVNVLAKIDENKITIQQETENGWTNLDLTKPLALSTNTELNETKIRVRYNGNLISAIYTLDVSSTSSNIELYPSGASEYIVKGFSQGLGKIVAKLSYAGFESFYFKSVELTTDVKIYPESIKLNGVATSVGLFSDNIFYNQNTKFVFSVSPAETSYKTLVLKVLTSDINSKIKILKQDGNYFVKEEGRELYNYLTAKEGFSYTDENGEYTYIVFASSTPIYINALSTGGTVQAEIFNNEISSISADVLLSIRRPVTAINFFADQELTESLSKVNLSEYQTRTIYFAYEPANAYFESLNFMADSENVVSITKGSEIINGTTYYKLILTALGVGNTTVKAYNGNNLIDGSSFDVTVFIPLEANGEDYLAYLSTQTPENNPLITAVNYSVNTGSVSDIKINNSNSTYENPIEFYVTPQPYNATISLDAEFELNGVVLEQTENDDGSVEVYKDLNGTQVCYFIYQKDTTNNTYKVFVQANAYGNSFVIRFIISGYSASGDEIVVTRSVNATIYNQVDYNNIHVLRNGTAKITSLTLKSSSTVGVDNLSEATSRLSLQIDKVVEGVNDYTVDVRLSGNVSESTLNYSKVLTNDFVYVLQTGKGEYSVIAGDLGAYSQMRSVLTFEITEDGKTFYYPVEIWVTNNTLTSEINVLNASKADDGANSFIRSYETGTTFALQTLVLPRDADNQTLEFVSSDENVFSVDESGVITFNGFGSASLYVLAKDSAHVSPENYFNYISGLISQEEFESLINYEVYSVIDVRVENGLDVAYSIYSASDINLLYKAENKYSKFIVQSDITLSGAFSSVESFAGEFNGNNKTISNLTSPLFGTIELGGRVTNVKIANSQISFSDSEEIGFIARNNMGSVLACVVDAVYKMESFNGSLGGVVGVNRGEVNFNTVSIRMAGEASVAGGVVGENYGVVQQNVVYFYGIADTTAEMAYAVKGAVAGAVVGENASETGIYNSVNQNTIYSYVDDNFVIGTTIGVVAGSNDGNLVENTLYNFTGTTSLDDTGVSRVIAITDKDEINLSVNSNAILSGEFVAIYNNDLFASVVAGEYKFNLNTWFNEFVTVDDVDTAINLDEKYQVYGLKEYTYSNYKVFSFTVYCRKNPAEQASYIAIIATEVEYSLYDASTGNKIDLNKTSELTIRKGASKEFYVVGEGVDLAITSDSANFEILNLGGGRYKVTHVSGNEGVINFVISRSFNINDSEAKVMLTEKRVTLYAVSGISDASFDISLINFSKQDIAVVTLSVTTDGDAPNENTIYNSILNQIKDQLGDDYTQGTVLDVIVKQTSSEAFDTVTDENGNVLTTFTKYYYTVQLFFNNEESLINVNYNTLSLDFTLVFNGYNDLGEAIEIMPTLEVNILPQEVDNVQFAYYSSNQLNGQLITTQAPQNVIVAGGSGLLEVYSYPYYADFDYATITSSSATTDDNLSFYLNFEQRFEKGNKYETAFTSGLYQSQDDYLRVNSVPYGTYLDKVTTYNDGVKGFNGFFYIWVVFDNIKANNLKDGTTFTITLTFYKQNGDSKDFLADEVIGEEYKFTLIYSRMPSAEVELADGGDVIVAGVDAELVITKGKATDRDPILSVAFASRSDNGTLSLVQKNGKYYIRTGIDLMKDNSSVSIVLYITTQKVLGGIVETLTTEKEFTVVKFKILSINFDENNLRKPTYESIGLSYKITAKYFTVASGYVATAVQQTYIDGIKAEIAELEKGLTYSNYTSEIDGVSKVNSRYVTFANYADYQDKIGFILSENKLAIYALKDVSEQMTLKAQITITYDSGSAIPKFVDPGATNNRVESTLDETFNASLVFTFYVDTSEENPTPINTLDDFLAILSRAGEDSVTEGHYRLNTNIYLTGWQADRSLNIESFDGNGYVIYINNFNTTSSNSEQLNIALFNEIGANTLVKNLIVCLPKGQTTIDVYDNLNLKTLNFAGIAITNNGSIYNSEVLSLNINAFNVGTEEGVTYHNYFAGASRPDAFRLEDYPHETHKMVETVNADGSVARTPATTTVVINSRSSVDLNAGLFVTNNNGNILNSRVGRSITSVYGTSDVTLANNSTISTNIGYQYMRDKFSNVSASKQVLDLSSYVKDGNGIQIVANGSVAGFVNSNNQDGMITNSYVANLAITNNFTTVSAAQTAGFVAVNYGTVMYSSVEGVASFTNADGLTTQDVQSVGSQIQGSGNIAGFVFENIGDITNSISNIRINTNAISAGFVYSNTGGGVVSQCLSFSKNNTSAVNSPFAGHTGLTSLQNGVVENCFYYDELQTLTSISEDDSATPFSNDIESSKAENYAGFAINELEKVKDENGNETAVEVSLRDVSYVWALKTLYNNSVEDRDVKYPVIVSAHQIAVTHYELKLGNSGDNSGKNFYLETSGQDAPVLISSEAEWNARLVNNNHNATSVIYGNFRLIDNVDFSENAIVKTSSYYFAGNLDGNGLTLNNFALEGGGDFDGLFKGIISVTSFGTYTTDVSDASPFTDIESPRKAVVKNITLAPQRVKSNAASAGVLAGIIYDANIYDITISSQNIKDDTTATTDPSILTAWFYAGGLSGVIWGDSVVNNITSNVGVMATSYLQETNKSSYYGEVNEPLTGLKFYVNKSEEGGAYVLAKFNSNGNNVTFIASEDVAVLVPHYSGGISAVVNIFNADDLKADTSSEEEEIATPNVERVTVDANSAFVSMAIHAGGVFGYVGEYTYVRDALFATQNVNGARISGYRVLGGVAGVNKGTLQFARLVFAESGDTSQLEMDEELFDTPYAYNADFHLFEISTTTDSSYATIYVGGVAGINIGKYVNEEFTAGSIIDSYSKVPIRPVFNQGTNGGYTFIYGDKEVVAGGLVGQMYGGTIRNAYVTGQVVANYSGGVIGIIPVDATGASTRVKLENINGMTNYVDKGWSGDIADTNANTYPNATRTTEYLTTSFVNRGVYKPGGIVSAFVTREGNEISKYTVSALNAKTNVEGTFSIDSTLTFEAKEINYNSLVKSNSFGDVVIPFVYSTSVNATETTEIGEILSGLEDYFAPFNETDDGTWEYTGFSEAKMLPYPTYGLVSTVSYIYDELTFYDIRDYSEKSYYIDPTLSSDWQKMYGEKGITEDNYFIEVNITEEDANGNVVSEAGWTPFHDGDFIGQLIGTRKIITLADGTRKTIYPTVKIKLSTSFTNNDVNLGIFDTLKTATVRNLNFEIILEDSKQPENEITEQTAFGFLAARAIDSKISNVNITWAKSVVSYSEGDFKNYLESDNQTAKTVTVSTAQAKLNVNYFGGLIGYEQGCEIENTSVNYNGNTVTLYEPWSMLPVAGASVASVVAEGDADDTIQYAGGLVGKSMDFPDRNARSEYSNVKVIAPEIYIHDYNSDTITFETTNTINLNSLYMAGLVGYMDFTKGIQGVTGMQPEVKGFTVINPRLEISYVITNEGGYVANIDSMLMIGGAFGFVDATVSGNSNESYTLNQGGNVVNLEIMSHRTTYIAEKNRYEGEKVESADAYNYIPTDDGLKVIIGGIAAQSGSEEKSENGEISHVKIDWNNSYTLKSDGTYEYQKINDVDVLGGVVGVNNNPLTHFESSFTGFGVTTDRFAGYFAGAVGVNSSKITDGTVTNFNNSINVPSDSSIGGYTDARYLAGFAGFNFGTIIGSSVQEASLEIDTSYTTSTTNTYRNTSTYIAGFVSVNAGKISYSNVDYATFGTKESAIDKFAGFVFENCNYTDAYLNTSNEVGIINNCYAVVNGRANRAAGFVYTSTNGEISECYSSGDISTSPALFAGNDGSQTGFVDGGVYIGGFAESATNTKFIDCYSNVKIVVHSDLITKASQNSVGGFLGTLSEGTTITNCYSVSTVKNENGYDSLTPAKAFGSYREGLFIGKIAAVVINIAGTMSNCYVVHEFGIHQSVIGRQAITGNSSEEQVVSDESAEIYGITRDYLVNYLDDSREFTGFEPLINEDNREAGAWVLTKTNLGTNQYHFPLLKAGSANYVYNESSGMYGVISGTSKIEFAGQAVGSRVNPTAINGGSIARTGNYVLIRSVWNNSTSVRGTEFAGYIAQISGATSNPNNEYGISSGTTIAKDFILTTPTPQAIVTGINCNKLTIEGNASGVYTNIYMRQSTSMFTGTAQNVVLENVLYNLSATSTALGLIADNVSSSNVAGATPNYFNNVNTKGTATARGGLINNLNLYASTYFFKCSNGVDINTPGTESKAGFVNYVKVYSAQTLKFEMCFNSGNITNSGNGAYMAGGLIGQLINTETGGSGTHKYAYNLFIDKCFNAANLTFKTAGVHAGGLVGYLEVPKNGGLVTISNSMSGGLISATHSGDLSHGGPYIGGLVGVIHKYDDSAAYGSAINIRNCLSLMDVWASYNDTNAQIGTISGVIHQQNNGIIVENCYYAEDLITGEIKLYRGTATTTEALSTNFSVDQNNPTLAGITSANGFNWNYEVNVFPFLSYIDTFPYRTEGHAISNILNYGLRGTYLFPNEFNSTDTSPNSAFKSGQATAIKTAYGSEGSYADNTSASKSNVTILGLGKTNYISNAFFNDFSGRIYSLNLDINCTVTTNKSNPLGGMINYTNGAVFVNNCSVSGSFNAKTNMGAFIGGTTNNVTIRMSTNSANVTQTFDDETNSTEFGVSGFIGYVNNFNDTTYQIIKCINRGAISSNKSAAGGFFGGGRYQNDKHTSQLRIYESVNQGAITGAHAGGLIGYSPFNISIADCYNVGTITATQTAGGLIGNAGSYSSDVKMQSSGTAHININNSYNASIINGGMRRAGIIGWMLYNTAEVTNSYWIADAALNTVAATYSAGGVATGDNLTKVVNCWHWNPSDSTWRYWTSYAKTMSTIFTYSNWSSESTYNPWVYGVTDTSIISQSAAIESLKVNTTNKWVLWGSDGSSLPTLTMQYKNVDPAYYLVYNEETLRDFVDSSKPTALQVGIYKSSAAIGTMKGTSISWTYDGNNYFVVNDGTGAKTGVFDRIQGNIVTIKNLGAVSTVGTGNASASKYGGMIGANNGNAQITVESLNFKNCWVSVSGTHTGTDSFGGFVSTQASGKGAYYENCKVYGTITTYAKHVGGITGHTNGGGTTYNTCTNNMAITASNTSTDLSNTAGGLVGCGTANTTFANCVNNANITSNTGIAGGLVGYNSCMVIANSSTSDSETRWSNSTNNGAISGVIVGGIAGQLKASVLSDAWHNEKEIKISGLQNNGTISAKTLDGKETYAGGIIGKSIGRFTMEYSTNESTGSITSEASVTTDGAKPYKHLGGLIGLHIGYNWSESLDQATLTLINCVNEARVTMNAAEPYYSNVGGLISHVSSADVIIQGCGNSGAISGRNYTAGGLIGYAQHAAYESTTAGSDGTKSAAGEKHTIKIMGYSSTDYSTPTCSTGNVSIASGTSLTTQQAATQPNNVGGLIGFNELNVIIDDNGDYSTNGTAVPISIGSITISGGKSIGGLIGQIGDNVYGTLKFNGYNTGDTNNLFVLSSGITLSSPAGGSDVQMGGLVGYISSKSSLEAKYVENNIAITDDARGHGNYFGGIVGQTLGNVTLTNCRNGAAIYATLDQDDPSGYGSYGYNCVGGLIGMVGDLTYVANSSGGETEASGAITITNCANGGYIGAKQSNATVFAAGYSGGMIGYLVSGSTLSVSNSTNDGTIHGIEIGGICGRIILSTADGLDIDNFDNTGEIKNISSSTSHAGGLFAFASGTGSGTLTDCTNNGAVTGSIYTGGFFSSCALNITFERCKNTASISTGDCVGGFVGTSSKDLTFTSCVNGESNTGATISGGTHSGGFIGYASSGTVNIGTSSSSSDNTNYMSVTATDNAGGFIGYSAANVSIYGGSTAETKVQNFGTISNNYSSTYSYLGGIIAYNEPATDSVLTMENVINNGQIVANNSEYGVYAGGIMAYTRRTPWTLTNVDNAGSITKGTNANTYQAGGIIGRIWDVASITLTDCDNTGSITCQGDVGGFIGNMSHGTPSGASPYYPKLTMTSCTNSGRIVTDGGDVGGFIGSFYSNVGGSTITDCTNSGVVTYENDIDEGMGGLIGYKGGYAADGSTSLTITRFKNTGNITGDYDVGGVIGEANSGIIIFRNCAISGNITGSGGSIWGAAGYTGHVIGAKPSFYDCSFSGSVISTDGDYSSTGGFVGILSEPATFVSCNVYGGTISAGTTSGRAGGFVGRAGYEDSTVSISSSYCSSSISGYYAGGFIGMAGSGSYIVSSITLSACEYYAYSTSSINGTYEGQLIGYVRASTLTINRCNSYMLSSSSNLSNNVLPEKNSLWKYNGYYYMCYTVANTSSGRIATWDNGQRITEYTSSTGGVFYQKSASNSTSSSNASSTVVPLKMKGYQYSTTLTYYWKDGLIYKYSHPASALSSVYSVFQSSPSGTYTFSIMTRNAFTSSGLIGSDANGTASYTRSYNYDQLPAAVEPLNPSVSQYGTVATKTI